MTHKNTVGGYGPCPLRHFSLYSELDDKRKEIKTLVNMVYQYRESEIDKISDLRVQHFKTFMAEKRKAIGHI